MKLAKQGPARVVFPAFPSVLQVDSPRPLERPRCEARSVRGRGLGEEGGPECPQTASFRSPPPNETGDRNRRLGLVSPTTRL